MEKKCKTCGAKIRIFKNKIGGAELYCENCNSIPKEIQQRFKELNLDLFNQYPKTLKNLKDGIKEYFNFFHKYKGFTIAFSSIFE